VSKYWHQARRLIVHNVLHADDTPHSIAMGAAIAMFIAVLPLIGIQMVLSVFIAALLRVNKAICIPIVWISNPITMVPLYAGCLAVGRFVMNSASADQAAVALTHLAEPARKVSWLSVEFWTNLLSNLVNLGVELWIGSAIVGLVLAILTYPATRWLVSAYRTRRHRHQMQKQIFKAPIATAEDLPKSEVA
jgi:hypothetical protein